jgi:hypothetical protein
MSRYEDHETRVALAAVRETGASSGKSPSADAEIVVALYLAAGGSRVTVTRNDDLQRFAANCESCGYVNGSGYRGESEDDTRHAQRHAEGHANAHAGTCRRIPERLWTKEGAR